MRFQQADTLKENSSIFEEEKVLSLNSNSAPKELEMQKLIFEEPNSLPQAAQIEEEKKEQQPLQLQNPSEEIKEEENKALLIQEEPLEEYEEEEGEEEQKMAYPQENEKV